MTNEIVKQDEAQLMEAALLQGDLAGLTPKQRVNYYAKVCESVGLNPFSRPFEYIVIKGKLTLYPTQACASQLRDINDVCIDDMTIQESDSEIIVTVKGHDKKGRRDVEIGAVSKKDMDGNLQNIRMKAVTKAKRRLSLSICGMGWVDDKYIEAISEGTPVIVNDEGEIRKPQSMLENMDALYPGYGNTPATSYSTPPTVVNALYPGDEKKPETRPYSPEALKARMAEMAKNYSGKEVTTNDRNILTEALGKIFKDDAERYQFCKWLTGEASTKKIPANFVFSMLKWMEVSRFEDAPDEPAIIEARTAGYEALRSMGQQELPIN